RGRRNTGADPPARSVGQVDVRSADRGHERLMGVMLSRTNSGRRVDVGHVTKAASWPWTFTKRKTTPTRPAFAPATMSIRTIEPSRICILVGHATEDETAAGGRERARGEGLHRRLRLLGRSRLALDESPLERRQLAQGPRKSFGRRW